MELAEIEQRLAALEKDVGDLKRIVGAPTENGNWIEKISGSMVGNPAFPEAMRMAAEIRRADSLAAQAGWLRDDPMFDACQEAIEVNRQKLDEEEGLP
jgi:hypothetical protein